MKIAPKLSIATGGDTESTASISAADWQRIEVSFGHALPPDVRQEVHEATNQFLVCASFERTAAPISASSEHVQSRMKAANDFLRSLGELGRDVPNDAATVADHLIEQHFSHWRFDGPRKLQRLSALMISYIAACQKAQEELKNPNNHGYRRGEQWDSWIRRLASILESYDMPIEVRKDTDKSKTDKPSPFVAFVHELQACIPADYRRATQSYGALSGKLNLATRQLRVK